MKLRQFLGRLRFGHFFAALLLVGIFYTVTVGPCARYIDSCSGERAKASSAKIDLKLIAQALELFQLEVGSYPTSQEGLDALLKNADQNPKWNGPYLKRDAIKDPWGNAYVYTLPGPNGRPFELKSLGADGKEGGEGPNADIVKN